jgi:hypothetical protein
MSQDYRLMERDVQVILDVYKYRYLSVSQITSLHFPSVQTTRRRLRVMTADGYLEGFTASGTPESIYYVTRKGAEVVAAHLNVPLTSLKWVKSTRSPKDHYFLQHFLKTNDFRIALTKACHISNLQISLLGYIPEYYSESTGKIGAVKYIRDFICDVRDPARLIHHTPDAVFALEKDGSPALFFLEIDRGTEVVNDPEKGFLKSFHFYLNYFVDGKYQKYSEEFRCSPFKSFRTLFVTTSQERLDNMRRGANGVYIDPPQVKRFIWLTTDEHIARDSMFQPIWQSADINDKSLYKIG